MSPIETPVFLKLGIYYASYLYFPAAALLIGLTLKSRGFRAVAAMAVLFVLSILAYARFIEPRILIVREHEAQLSRRCFDDPPALRLAIFADTHNGIFANAMPIDRIVARVNTLGADAVLIPGDFTYYPKTERIPELFAALGDIAAPTLAVLGNHDIGYPGPDLAAPLNMALAAAGVEIIDDRKVVLDKGGRKVELVGLSDLWGGAQEKSLLTHDPANPRILLTHNPSTAQHLHPRKTVDLLIAGHTHGGQIHLPGLTCRLVAFACRVTRYGLAAHKRADVFVTSGTGMVGLPLRFNMAPRIDVLNVRFQTCAAMNAREERS